MYSVANNDHFGLSFLTFRDLTDYVNTLPSSDDDKDAFVMFSYRNNQAGTLGIAWLGTTCVGSSQKGYRSSINEYYQSQQITATVSLCPLKFEETFP